MVLEGSAVIEKICMNCKYAPEREMWIMAPCSSPYGMCRKGCGWVHKNDRCDRFKIKKELRARRRYKFVER